MKKTLFLLLAILPLVAIAQQKITRHYAWEGKMGEGISFRLELEQADNNLVIGETTYYRKNGKVADIPVYGQYLALEDGYELILNEYDGREECGTIIIELDKNGIFLEGSWSNDTRSYDFREMNKVGFSYGKHETFIFPATGALCTGEYGFKYKSGNPTMPEYGGYAALKVSGKVVNWEMNQVTPNIADANGKSVMLGNTFSGSTGNFKFKAYVYKDCLFVVNTNPQDAPWDEFGHNATLAGIYLKHKTVKK